MLGNGKWTVTGRPGDDRSASRGSGAKHNGYDIAAPGGTPVMAPSANCELRVADVGTDRHGGNFVVLEGQLVDGRSVSFTMRHLQDGSIRVKKGDTARPGTVIAAVGNTGTTGNSKRGFSPYYPGKDFGFHLHIEPRIGGKLVAPDKFYQELAYNSESKKAEIIARYGTQDLRPSYQRGPQQTAPQTASPAGETAMAAEELYQSLPTSGDVGPGTGLNSETQTADAQAPMWVNAQGETISGDKYAKMCQKYGQETVDKQLAQEGYRRMEG